MTRLPIFLHLLGVVVWIGGMSFMTFCLRPVAVAQLSPAQRLPLLVAVMGRFLAWVGISLVLIWGSGLWRFTEVGGALVPPHWHAMAKVGAGMTAIYLYIALRLRPRLKAAVVRQDWPTGGAVLTLIGKLVMLNLALGLLTMAIAVLGA
ncbi:MAG: hypothetical protein CVU17_05630 [Betaproteobacteria bacterium HGW-Betaproteobacteria-11]|nr:MAG: hypothetical protein CVU17_05630 [Betaproteobacteria bacterium HGW-Betaproteobacteria-11]